MLPPSTNKPSVFFQQNCLLPEIRQQFFNYLTLTELNNLYTTSKQMQSDPELQSARELISDQHELISFILEATSLKIKSKLIHNHNPILHCNSVPPPVFSYIAQLKQFSEELQAAFSDNNIAEIKDKATCFTHNLEVERAEITLENLHRSSNFNQSQECQDYFHHKEDEMNKFAINTIKYYIVQLEQLLREHTFCITPHYAILDRCEVRFQFVRSYFSQHTTESEQKNALIIPHSEENVAALFTSQPKKMLDFLKECHELDNSILVKLMNNSFDLAVKSHRYLDETEYDYSSF